MKRIILFSVIVSSLLSCSKDDSLVFLHQALSLTVSEVFLFFR